MSFRKQTKPYAARDLQDLEEQLQPSDILL